MSSNAGDALSLVVASACAAALVATWLSLVVSLAKRSWGGALLACLVIPAPWLAWNAGLRVRATAMPVLAAVYALARLVSR